MTYRPLLWRALLAGLLLAAVAEVGLGMVSCCGSVVTRCPVAHSGATRPSAQARMPPQPAYNTAIPLDPQGRWG